MESNRKQHRQAQVWPQNTVLREIVPVSRIATKKRFHQSRDFLLLWKRVSSSAQLFTRNDASVTWKKSFPALNRLRTPRETTESLGPWLMNCQFTSTEATLARRLLQGYPSRWGTFTRLGRISTAIVRSIPSLSFPDKKEKIVQMNKMEHKTYNDWMASLSSPLFNPFLGFLVAGLTWVIQLGTHPKAWHPWFSFFDGNCIFASCAHNSRYRVLLCIVFPLSHGNSSFLLSRMAWRWMETVAPFPTSWLIMMNLGYLGRQCTTLSTRVSALIRSWSWSWLCNVVIKGVLWFAAGCLPLAACQTHGMM